MIGRVENAIIGGATLNFDFPDPFNCNPAPNDIAYDNSPVAATFCDCNNPDFCNYGGFGSQKCVNCETHFNNCVYIVNPNSLEDCRFADYIGCCCQFCAGDTFQPRNCGNCFFQQEEVQSGESFITTSTSTPAVIWEVIETTTTAASDSAYTADCNKMIATIVYDNEQLRINIGARIIRNNIILTNGGNCGARPISSCPKIKIVLPDDTYGTYQSTDSSCEKCSKKRNIIEITESPVFETITETKYYILDTFSWISPVQSDITTGFPCGTLANQATSFSSFNAESVLGQPHYISSRIRECGKPLDNYQLAGTSYSAWAYFLPSAAIARSSLETPEGSECSVYPSLSNAQLVGINPVMSNGESASAAIEAWKANMAEAFATKHFCFNSANFNEDDLIEGPIPGSCTLNFAGGSWPAYAIRTSRTLKQEQNSASWEFDSEARQTSANFQVAYVSYSYKRPVSIQDKFVEIYSPEISVGECNSFFGATPKNALYASTTYNIKEIFKSTETIDTNCAANPQCYDSTRGCAPTNYCCGTSYGRG